MSFEVADIAHPTGPVHFMVPNPQCEMRVRSFFTKEPDTVEWISEFNPGDVFLDVGANVGMYSLWAAKTTGARVFAFEPESQNFALLCQNILINRVDVLAYPLALSDENAMAPLFLSGFGGGGSCHSIAECVNFKGENMRPAFVQGSFSMELDTLVETGAIPQPDYIKIDVDGFEHKVLRGGKRAIEKAKSVLIELDSNAVDHQAALYIMEGMGFRWDAAQADAARRKAGAFKGIGNVIFRR